MDIDNIDFAVLKCINDANRPLWKNKIHELIGQRVEQLPLTSPVSVQTVGRRVDTMTENGVLESAIVSPEDIKRDLIIAFKLTEDGQRALKDKAEEYLKQTVRDEIFDEEQAEGIGKPALLELMQEQLRLSKTDKNALAEHTYDDLVTLMIMYYVRNDIIGAFNGENMERLFNITDVNGELSQALEHYVNKLQSV